jgi:ubiquinone/menaquinone biosynthesis C-methylase UbiE
MIKGLLYSNVFFYNFITTIKLWKNKKLRFLLAANYINPSSSVLDYCAGTGELKNFLSSNCFYSTIEMSEEFSAYLVSKGIKNYKINPLREKPFPRKSFDIITIIISLYHFKNDDGINILLKQMKEIAVKRVIIVEEVLYNKKSKSSPYNSSLRTIFFQNIGKIFAETLCTKPYVSHSKLLNDDELRDIFQAHSIKIVRETNNYIVGVWEREES